MVIHRFRGLEDGLPPRLDTWVWFQKLTVREMMPSNHVCACTRVHTHRNAHAHMHIHTCFKKRTHQGPEECSQFEIFIYIKKGLMHVFSAWKIKKPWKQTLGPNPSDYTSRDGSTGSRLSLDTFLYCFIYGPIVLLIKKPIKKTQSIPFKSMKKDSVL